MRKKYMSTFSHFFVTLHNGNFIKKFNFVEMLFLQLLHIQTVRTGRVTKTLHHVASLVSFWPILLENAHAPSAVSAFSNRLSVFVWTGENDLKTLNVDGNCFFCFVFFFWRGKNSSVFILKRIRVDGALINVQCRKRQIQ